MQTSEGEKVDFVHHTAVAEVLLDIRMLDFGKGVTAKANVAVWRTRGDEKQLVGEFAYQCKFRRRDELQAVAMKRCEQFFCSLQLAARDWVSLSTTKTGAVYRLKRQSSAARIALPPALRGGGHFPIGRCMFLAQRCNGNHLPFGDSPKSGQRQSD